MIFKAKLSRKDIFSNFNSTSYHFNCQLGNQKEKKKTKLQLALLNK